MIPEIVVLNHLKANLDVPVSMEHLPESAGSYVVVERLGGTGTTPFIVFGSFAIQSYGTTLLEACELNEKVKKAMFALIESEHVSQVQLDTDYNHTDTTTKEYRYQAVFDLVFFA